MSTQRTKAELDVLFADNTTRQITPERLRDFVESCVPSYGALHFDDPGTLTPIAAPATWTKATNTSALHATANRFSQSANNRLRYDGTTNVVSFLIATLSFTAAGNNKILAFALAINGVVEEASKVRTKITTGTDVQAATVTMHPVLAPGDYVELYVMNETDDTDLTVEHAHITALAFMT